jgi:hypothetical protein
MAILRTTEFPTARNAALATIQTMPLRVEGTLIPGCCSTIRRSDAQEPGRGRRPLDMGGQSVRLQAWPGLSTPRARPIFGGMLCVFVSKTSFTKQP